MATQSSSDAESVVRRYYAIVSDLGSSEEDLRSVLAPDLRVTEHPNLVTPTGAVRDLEGTIRGFHAGKSLLKEQLFDVHEVFSAEGRVAVRATWRGVVGVEAGPFRRGHELVAHVAALLTVRDSLVVQHETFDCYDRASALPGE